MTITFVSMEELAVLKERADAEGKFLVLDVFASWCGPCRMLAPKLDALASQRDDELIIVKGDGEKVEGLVAAYPVTNLPALFLLQNGKVLATKEGSFASVEALSAWVDDAMPI